MSSLIYVYPLDLQADLESNHIHGEPHTLAPGVNRVIVPNHGAFYTKDLVVREAITGRVLEPIVDYVPVMYYQEPSERSGLEVMAAIVVTNGEVDPAIEVDMRLVGGMYTNITQPLIELIANLNLDDRTVRYGDLLGKPHAFHPAHHLHDIGDVYGFEYMVEAIDRLVLAVFHGDQAAFDELRQYVNQNDDALHERINSTNANLGSHVANVSNPHSVTKAQVGLGLVQNLSLSSQAQMSGSLQATSYVTPLALTYYFQTGNGLPITEHLVDVSNPHNTTKAQVGLGIVENFSISTQSEAEVGTVSNKYMTPLRTAQAIQKQAGDLLNAHTINYSNPHQVTKAQTGLGSVQNYGIATQAEAQAGTVNTKYMTPLRVAEAIVTQALTPLNAHASRIDNPHSVTKAQVGLSVVENYSISTQAEAQAGSVNNKYMTPLRTKEAIVTQAIAPLNAHTVRVDNPHQVTKAQVGLSVVENYPIATTTEANTGTANDRYMTPLLTKYAIETQALVPLTNHANRGDNPHNVTKAQVGLGSVQNYPIASQAEAEAGTATTRYMTPLRVAEAITVQAGTLLNTHVSNTNNPHAVTKAQVGLGSVLNYGISDSASAIAGTSNVLYMTPLRTKEAITAQAGTLLNAHTTNYSNPHQVTKAQVGLGNVDNTSDTAKPVSTAQQTALNLKVDKVSGYSLTKNDFTDALLAKLNGIAAGAQVNVGTNLSMGGSGNSRTINSSTGSNVSVPVVTTSNAGFMSTTDKSKLDGIQAGAQVNSVTSVAGKTGAVSLTNADVGLNMVWNYGIATQAEAQAGTVNTEYMTPLRTKQAISSQVGSMGFRNVFISTGNPGSTSGAVGDVWFKYS